MANIKSSIKRALTNDKKKLSNNDLEKSMRTAVKKVEVAVLNGNKAEANKCLCNAFKKIDKTAKAGIIKDNKRNRNKSCLAKKVNELK
ncbi:MAG: 30S ribosomal protein S20 [Bacilli bacterium]